MRYNTVEEFKAVAGHDVDGVWYPRVTKILEIKSKPALEQFWRELGSFAFAEEVKEKSAAEGTRIHQAVEQFVKGGAGSVPDEIAPAMHAFESFYTARGITFHSEYIERSIWSPRHRYAGTIDALATIDGKFGVLDIKTSIGFFPEYNLQTAAYVSALQEFSVKRALALPRDIETRWILRINQHQVCQKCGATLRTKGGRSKIRNGGVRAAVCTDENAHAWGDLEGDVALREFPYFYKDIKAFVAAKILWEWEHEYWLRRAGYLI